MRNNKQPLFYICVEQTRDFSVGLEIYYFLCTLGVKANIWHPAFSSGCLRNKFRRDKKSVLSVFKECSKVVLICVSRDILLLPLSKGIVEISSERNFLYRLKSILFSKRFVLGVFHYLDKDKQIANICLSMNAISRQKIDPLAVFIHELLHLKRYSDCSTKGCIGRCYCKKYFICEKCVKLLNEIVNGNF